MFPGGPNEHWKRNLEMKQAASRGSHHSNESNFSWFSSPPHPPCPKHSGQHFHSQFDFMPSFEDTDRNLSDFHNNNSLYNSKSCLSSSSSSHPVDLSSLEISTLQLQYLLRQRELYGPVERSFENLLSPPATASSSQITSFSCKSAPPFLSRGTSPADDINAHCGSFDTSSHFSFNSAIKHDSYFKRDEAARERSTIYTAEDVHTVVKNHRDGKKERIVSNKVFVGGLSHSTNREVINTFFGKFGTVFVDWPVKQKANTRGKPTTISSYSYLFLVYSEEASVIKLMHACKQAGSEFFVTVPGCHESAVQIRPWFIKNAFYISSKAMNARIVDVHRTVFVGGLPRIVTAHEIAQMFSEFGKVLLVTIDIDQDYGYPKGAARVTFERDASFNKALEKKYLKFENIDSSKTIIEIKPYVVEDVGCDECGGLWSNPFLDIYDQLMSCKENLKKPQVGQASNIWSSNSSKPFDNKLNPFGTDDLISRMDVMFQNGLEQRQKLHSEDECAGNELESGVRKFLALTKSFGLDKEKTVNINGTEYCVGPDLWDKFVPRPSFEMGIEPVQMEPEEKIKSFLRMKRANVFSNKSSYCKERPCRQYYCPSCSNKLHSGPNQHLLLPAGRPERRPRKDKNMYLVSLNN